MDWLLLEDGRLLNPESGIIIEFREMGQHSGKAIVWGFGVPLHSDSMVVGEYYLSIRAKILADRESAADSTSGEVPADGAGGGEPSTPEAK